ncbi:MAG: DUF2341 domain-containing protein, partial [Candidatus Hodarchaeales archaeon]
SSVQVDGGDIFFTDYSGTKLNHEIDLYDRLYNSTHAHLVAWVQANLSSSQDTVISMYYGNSATGNKNNPEAVWSDNYVMVQHLNEDPTGSIYDSTDNSHDGATTGSMISSDLVEGKIGKAFYFESSKMQAVEIPDSNDFDMTETLTLSAWVNVPASVLSTGEYHIIAHNKWGDNVGYVLMFRDGGLEFRFHDGTALRQLITYSHGVTADTWHHLIGYFDRPTIRLYVDGSQVASGTLDYAISHHLSIPVKIGRTASGSQFFIEGSIDEARIRSVPRSENWITAEYTNQQSPNNFYLVGTTETSPVTENWAYPIFKYRKNLTIDASKVSGSGNLINFPVMINITDTDLQDTEKIQADGDDIAFTDASGTKLDHETEFFDQNYNSTHAHLIAWVKIPSLSGTSDTNITMYYGNNVAKSQENPTGVWSNNFIAVYHVNEGSGTSTADVAGGHDGTLYSGTSWEDSRINKGLYFDGTDNSYVQIPYDSIFSQTERITVETWVKVPASVLSGSNRQTIFSAHNYPIKAGYRLRFDSGELQFGFYDWSTIQGVSTADHGIQADTWSHVVGLFNRPNLELYVNGTLVASKVVDIPMAISMVDPRMGRGAASGDPYNGSIDELRISKVGRSSDWINTSYNNQYDSSSFFSVSNEDVYKYWWADASFTKRKDMIINNSKVSGDLTNFPILIDITDTDLSTGNIQPDAGDLLFTYANGTKLDHEVDEFSQNALQGSLIAWVRMPELSSTENTVISMYYGNSELENYENPDGVWDSNYMAVHHLKDLPTGTVYDSTSNNIDTTSQGAMTAGDLVDGWIGKGIDFDGSNDGLQSSNSVSINQFTMGVWFKQGVITSSWRTLICVTEERQFCLDDQIVDFWTDINNRFGGVIPAGSWHYLTLTFNGSKYTAYLDGSQHGNTITDSLSEVTDPIEIGFWKTSDPQTFDGILDEARISNISRSIDWIATEYNNQYNPANFYTVGAEMIFDQTPPTINDYGIEDLGTGTGMFWADITDTTSDVTSAKIEINSTEFSMSYNGTYWVYQIPVTWQGYYEYRIKNATDAIGNFITTATSIKGFTFDFDSVAPSVDDWEYYSNIGFLGTFNTNVSDDWGEIDIVMVNVSLTQTPFISRESAVMRNTSTGFINDTLNSDLENQNIYFVITVNDTSGNSYTTITPRLGYVKDRNNLPKAFNLTFVPDPLYSNSTLQLEYNYTDLDNDLESGTEVLWYKNDELQPDLNMTVTFLNHSSIEIPSNYLFAGDQWYVTVKPHDGYMFGLLNTSATITVQNSIPVVITCSISPGVPTNISNLTAINTTVDSDGDMLTYEIEWYRNAVNQTHLYNKASVEADNTTKGDFWYFRIRAHDGTVYSSWNQSTSVEIVNSAPYLLGTPTFNDTISVTQSDDLNISYAYGDIDNDIEDNTTYGLYVRWYKWNITHGIVYQSQKDNESELLSTETLDGEVWYYFIRVFDGYVYSAEIESEHVSINFVNALPVANFLNVTTASNDNYTLDDLQSLFGITTGVARNRCILT